MGDDGLGGHGGELEMHWKVGLVVVALQERKRNAKPKPPFSLLSLSERYKNEI